MNSFLSDNLVCRVAEQYGPGTNATCERDHGGDAVLVSWHDERHQHRRCISVPTARLLLSYDQFANLFADDVADKYYKGAPREIRKSSEVGAPMNVSLKSDILMIANLLADGENMTKSDADRTLRDTVTRTCATPGISTLAIAMIAVHLADALDKDSKR